jgi:1-deoxy-D-xylulose-5-phosphate reductoisomerase
VKRIALLGATGSIGAATLDVIARHPDRYRVHALTAHRQVDALLDLCRRHLPAHAAVADAAAYPALRDGLRAMGLDTRAHAGAEAITALAADPASDIVVAAIVGAAGMPSTLAAALAGKRLLLANKESLVLGGELMMRAAREGGAELIPVDSEHNAIFQCLPAQGPRSGVRRLILTASGGPFRGRDRASLAAVTPEQACAHPKWSMGRKISVDSATLMNKGLEVIEAHHLFGMPAEGIEVWVHPQSVVHSLVDYVDGSVLAQLGHPDMRTAISHALAHPDRIDSGVRALDLGTMASLQFEAPDLEAFPCLRLAYAALRTGGSAPAALNAANEVAVSAFLQGRLAFLAIPALIEDVLSATELAACDSIEALLEADAGARRAAHHWLERDLQA